MRIELHWRDEDGIRLPMACWQPGPGYRMIASSVLGGGIGPRDWVLNAQVPGGYSRMDPTRHLTELAASLGLAGPGVGMLTAAQVTGLVQRSDEDVEAAVTTGLRVPTWAAAPADAPDPELKPIYLPGTINILVRVPVPLTDAALVNAVITATEAKTQAVLAAGFAGTGTASDAICVACPGNSRPDESDDNSKKRDASRPDNSKKQGQPGHPGQSSDNSKKRGSGEPSDNSENVEDFAGPRSRYGARIARAVYAAVLAGAAEYQAGL